MSTVTHPQVADVMRRYMEKLNEQIVLPALKDLDELQSKQPKDRALADQIQFVKDRIEHRIGKISAVVAPRQ